jgi:hypothetical protein
VLLGASQFPNFPRERHLDNPSFGNSARAFQSVISDGDVSLSGKPSVLDLFDSDLAPQEIIRRIRDFLKAEANITDVVLYYCGHGSFLSDRTYFLMIRATEPDSEAFTGLPWRQMRHTLEPHLANKRVYIVLDCCFAGRAITEFQSVALGPLIEEQTFHALPRRGTALVAASAHGDVAIAPGERSLTMFTGALVEAIENGLEARTRTLSFRDLVAGIRRRLPELYPGRAVLPQIHDPVQPEGDVSATPLFINRAFQPPKEPDATESERETFDFAVSDLERPLARTRLAAIATLEGLIESTRSRPFRQKILDRIGKAEAEDDSRAVVIRATQTLQRFSTVADASRTARDSESGSVTDNADAVEQCTDAERSVGRTDADASVTGDVTKPTRITFIEALKGIFAYGIAPGFVTGFLQIIIVKLFGFAATSFIIAQFVIPTASGYVLAKRTNLPTLTSIIGLAITGLAMGICELVPLGIFLGTPALVVPICVLGTFLGWGLLLGFERWFSKRL